MIDEGLMKMVGLVGAFSLIGAVLMLLMILTLFFGAIRKIEDQVATPGKQLDGVIRVWGNGPIGRWMRAVHLYGFFVFRRLPVVGPTIESRFGDENSAVPRKLKLSLMIPMHLFFLLMFIVIGCAVYTAPMR